MGTRESSHYPPVLRLARRISCFSFSGGRRAGRTALEEPEFGKPHSEDEGSLARSRQVSGAFNGFPSP